MPDDVSMLVPPPQQDMTPVGAQSLTPTAPSPSMQTAEAVLARTDPVLGADARINTSLAQRDQLYNRQEQLLAQQIEQAQKHQAAMEPRYEALEREVAGRQLPPMPQEVTPPKPPTYQDAQKQTWEQGWVSAAMFLAVLGGSLTRRPITNALAAFGGMANGIAEGNKELYEANMKTWEAENKRAIEMNTQAQKRYETILKRQDVSIEQKKIMMEIEAMRWQDQGMMMTAQQKGLEELGHILDGRDRFLTDFQNKTQQWELSKARLEEIRARTAAKTTASLTPEAARDLAERVLAGESNPTVGQSQANRALIQNMVSEIGRERGYKPAEIAAAQAAVFGERQYQRTAGAMGARVESAMNEVDQLLPLAVEASRNLPRTDLVAINKIIQEGLTANTGYLRHIPGIPEEVHIPVGEKDWSDPRYHDFLVKNFSLINAYQRAMNPQGVPRIAERIEREQAGILSMTSSNEAYEVQTRAMLQEVYASKIATSKTRGIPYTGPSADEVADRLGLARPPKGGPQPQNVPPAPIERGENFEIDMSKIPTMTWADKLRSMGLTVQPMPPGQ